MMIDLRNKNALVIESSRGIGQQITIGLQKWVVTLLPWPN